MTRAILASAVLFLSCATPAPAIVASGKSLETLGQLFDSLALVFYGQCAQHDNPDAKPLFSVKTCTDWADFADNFKQAYLLAAAGYDLAAQGVDGGSYSLSNLTGQLYGFNSLAVAAGLKEK